MATVEVDELEFQQNKRLRDEVAKIMANPKAKKKLLEADKIINPEKKIPEIDDQTETEKALAAQQKAFEDYKKEQEEKEAKREQENTLRGLKSKRDEGIAALKRDGWMKESIEEVEKIMDEQGILDPAIAAAYYEKLHPPADPIVPGGAGAWNFLEPTTTDDQDAYTKKLFETKGDNMGNLALHEARKTLAEMRQRARR